MMTDKRVMDIDELKAFLASSDVLMFKAGSREEIYAWIEHTLRSSIPLLSSLGERGAQTPWRAPLKLNTKALASDLHSWCLSDH